MHEGGRLGAPSDPGPAARVGAGAGGGAAGTGLLVVLHSRTGSTRELCEAALAAAVEGAPEVAVVVRDAFEAGPGDVLAASGVLIATPARFGSMSGACKDFFERIYHPCLGRTVGLPYTVLVKGDTDVDGAVASITRIATGLQWRIALPPVTVVGDPAAADLERCRELGAAFAAGLSLGVF